MAGTARIKVSRKDMQEILGLPGYTTWITGASWDPNTLSVVIEVTGNDVEDESSRSYVLGQSTDPREVEAQ